MKKHSQIVLFALSLCVLFLNLDCKKNPVAPPPPNGNDTTSNNFTFQTFAFGGNAGSCVLSDVAIISPTDIWAVGAVYLDSADGAPDPFPYNAVHWDGTSWQLRKITVQTVYGPVTSPLEGVFAFSSGDIWLIATDPMHGDGNTWTDYDVRGIIGDGGLTVSKGWGTSSSNMFFVGRAGSIVHYNGASWTKIATGTSLAFNDIYGSGGQILAVCTQDNPPGDGIYNIQGNTATQIPSNPINQIEEFFSIWFVPNQQYYVVGDGIYQKNSLSDGTWINGPLDITHYATTKVRGNNINDVVVVGAFGEFLHWNGVRWKSYIDQTGLSNGSYTSVAVSGNLVVAVGGNNAQAVITMGTRQ
jgi:hypothetical protein